MPFNTPVGYTNTLDLFGDSLMAGAGGGTQTIATCLQALMPLRIINNWGIGGQISKQIAARQGGLPVLLTIPSNSIPAGYSPATVTPSIQLLSTPSNNGTNWLSGTIAGVPALLTRTATGGPPSTSETYTLTRMGSDGAATVPAWAPFIPDTAFNAKHSVQVLAMGRNDVGTSDLVNVPAYVAGCVATIPQPQRYVVCGVLAALGEINGTANKTAIDACNAQLAATYGALFVPYTPPTVAEMTAVGYTPTTQDTTDIANGVFPTGLRADSIHLIGPGYQILANRIKTVLDAQGW